MTQQPEMRLVNSEHVPFLAVPVIGLVLGFVSGWGVGALCLLAAVLAHGLFGISLEPPPLRVLSAVFSGVFVTICVLGWASWLLAALKASEAK